MINVHFYDLIVHFIILGMANCPSGQPFQMCSEIPIEAFDVCCMLFPNDVPFSR